MRKNEYKVLKNVIVDGNHIDDYYVFYKEIQDGYKITINDMFDVIFNNDSFKEKLMLKEYSNGKGIKLKKGEKYAYAEYVPPNRKYALYIKTTKTEIIVLKTYSYSANLLERYFIPVDKLVFTNAYELARVLNINVSTRGVVLRHKIEPLDINTLKLEILATGEILKSTLLEYLNGVCDKPVKIKSFEQVVDNKDRGFLGYSTIDLQKHTIVLTVKGVHHKICVNSLGKVFNCNHIVKQESKIFIINDEHDVKSGVLSVTPKGVVVEAKGDIYVRNFNNSLGLRNIKDLKGYLITEK